MRAQMPVTSGSAGSDVEPDPRALQLPARFDRCLLPQLTPDRRLIYSTDALEYLLVLRHGWSSGRVRAWLLEITQDTRPWTPDFPD